MNQKCVEVIINCVVCSADDITGVSNEYDIHNNQVLSDEFVDETNIGLTYFRCLKECEHIRGPQTCSVVSFSYSTDLSDSVSQTWSSYHNNLLSYM